MPYPLFEDFRNMLASSHGLNERHNAALRATVWCVVVCYASLVAYHVYLLACIKYARQGMLECGHGARLRTCSGTAGEIAL